MSSKAISGAGTVHFGCDGVACQEFGSAFGVHLPFLSVLPFAAWSLGDPTAEFEFRTPSAVGTLAVSGTTGRRMGGKCGSSRHLLCSGSEVGLMQRRKFIARLGVAAAWPIVAKAQERERIRRVSVLMNRVATDTEPQSWLAAFIHR